MSDLPPSILVAPGYAPNKEGSLERYLLTLAGALRSEGVRVDFALPGEPASSFAGPIGEAGAGIHLIPGRQSGIPHVRRIARLVRRCKAACVLVGFPPGNFEAVLGARLGGARVVVQRTALLLLDDQARLRPALRHRLRARLYAAGLSRIIAVSEAVRQEQIALGVPPAKVTTIANGVDLDLFRPGAAADRALDVPGLDGGPIVLSVANMYDRTIKGLPDLIEAASQVTKDFPQARFVIVGDGPYRSEFEAQAQRLGLAHRAVFAGLRNDVAQILKSANLLAVSSLSEAACLSILEAMAAGKAVVATRVGGNPEMVADGETGILVPARAPRALAEAIGQCLADPDRTRAMGARGRERAARRFTLDRMVEQTVDLFRECWAEAAGGGRGIESPARGGQG